MYTKNQFYNQFAQVHSRISSSLLRVAFVANKEGKLKMNQSTFRRSARLLELVTDLLVFTSRPSSCIRWFLVRLDPPRQQKQTAVTLHMCLWQCCTHFSSPLDIANTPQESWIFSLFHCLLDKPSKRRTRKQQRGWCDFAEELLARVHSNSWCPVERTSQSRALSVLLCGASEKVLQERCEFVLFGALWPGMLCTRIM